MDRFIKVTLQDAGGEAVVTAVDNPLEIEPGDTVTWRLNPMAVERKIRVKFVEVRLLSEVGFRKDSDPDGPFVALSQNGAEVFGTLRQELGRDRRFIYKFVAGEGDEGVKWGNPLDGTENFGGLDIPQPPPRGG